METAVASYPKALPEMPKKGLGRNQPKGEQNRMNVTNTIEQLKEEQVQLADRLERVDKAVELLRSLNGVEQPKLEQFHNNSGILGVLKRKSAKRKLSPSALANIRAAQAKRRAREKKAKK